jgi:hypothetical protein
MHPSEAHMYPALWTRCYTWSSIADAQVDQNVLARDAICDLIRDFVALSVSNVLERFQHVLPRLVDRDRCRAGKHSRQRVTR